MSYPIIGILGGSKSGKDTVAEVINGYLGGVSVAQADPMKRFAKKIFEFTDEQLWGPSENRNAIDERGSHDWYWADVRARMNEHAPAFFQAWGLPLDKWSWLNTQGGTWGGLESTKPQPLPALASFEAHGPLVNHFNDLRVNHRKDFSARIQLQKFGTEFGRALNKNLWSLQAIRRARSLLEGGFSDDRMVGVEGTKDFNGNIPNWVTITDVRFRNEALNIKDDGGLLIKVINPEVDGAVNVGITGHASETELLSIPTSWLDHSLVNNKKMGLNYLRMTAVPYMLEMLNLGDYVSRLED